MRTRLAGLSALALGLALGASAAAQTQTKDAKDDGKRGADAPQQTVRGVIAGVTVEGELAVDYKAKKAVEVEMTFLTILGRPRGEGARRDGEAPARANQDDRNSDRGNRGRRGDRASADRGRMNVYVVWITPKTTFRDAEARGDRRDGADRDRSGRSKDAPNSKEEAAALALDDLEIGDRIEVTFNVRDETNTGAGNEQMRRKHGRHRTYFGDAVSITLVAEPNQDRDRDNDNGRDENRGRNREGEPKTQSDEKK